MKEELVYLDGEILTIEHAKVSVLDHGYLYGDGIFETMRSYGGVIFKLDEHIQRLHRSAEAVFINISLSDDEIREELHNLLSLNNLKYAYLRMSVSRGAGGIGLSPKLCPKPTTLIIARQFRDYPEEYYREGVGIVSINTNAGLPDAVTPVAKTSNYLKNILGKIYAEDLAAFETVFINALGKVTECTVTNIFCVKNGKIVTSDESTGILPGITRATVIEIAGNAGIEVEEKEFGIDELKQSDECFITNTSVEIMPVTNIDGKKVGTGQVGEITGSLTEGFRKYADDYVGRFLK